jgi:hypothetical protein
MKKTGDLHIDQDNTTSNLSHRIKVTALWMLVVIQLAVIAGVTGKGLFSRHVSGSMDAGALLISEKIVRYESSVQLEMHVNTLAMDLRDSLLDVSIPVDYMGKFMVEGIMPEPEATEISHNRIIYRFRVRDTGEAQTIRLDLRPRHLLTSARADITIGGTRVQVSQYILP